VECQLVAAPNQVFMKRGQCILFNVQVRGGAPQKWLQNARDNSKKRALFVERQKP
jgi:hypothetical protein